MNNQQLLISPSHCGGGDKSYASQCHQQDQQQMGDGFAHPHNVIQTNNQVNARLGGLEDWLNGGTNNINDGNPMFANGMYPQLRCHSPQSSALGDAEESDDKEGDESCWSEGSHGTNDNDGSTNGSCSESMSSLQPDLNWTEAVRLMSENKWPQQSPKQFSIHNFSNTKYPSEKDKFSDVIPENLGYNKNEDETESKRKLLGQRHERDLQCDSPFDGSEYSSNYYCQLPSNLQSSGGNNAKKLQRTSVGAKEITKTSKEGEGGGVTKKHSTNHSRNTSLTSPLV